MQHKVLARKWRPKKFTDLVGQNNTVKILSNIIRTNRIHHAILLTGTRGVGKTTIARIIAKSLNCLNPKDAEPCTVCDNCKQIDSGSFVDVIEIDAASNTGVDNVRELIDNSQYAPTLGRYKIYIIDEVHMLSKSAFNAMLKTLEEPPEFVVFILATTDLPKVPITILSRCLQLKLRNLHHDEISSYLEDILNTEKFKYELKALNLIATAAQGSMRDALSLLDQAIAFSDDAIKEELVRDMLGKTSDEIIYTLIKALIETNSTLVMNIIKNITSDGYDLEDVILTLNEKLCNLSVIQLTGVSNEPDLNKYIDKISINDIHLFFEIANLGLEQMQKTNDKYSIFVMTLCRMLAFKIGSNQNKEVLLEKTNFTPTTNPNAAITTQKPSENKTTNKINSEVESIIETKEIVKEKIKATTNESTVSVNKFDGNWFELITTLKINLGAMYPFLENSTLENYDEKKSTFTIIIDERYKVAFNQSFSENISKIIGEYLQQKVTVIINFSEAISNTLKEKNNQIKQINQSNIENAMENDEYFLKLKEQFSATIVPGSVKSKD
jgi:DNA polymerase-3 subunit gamma/tau